MTAKILAALALAALLGATARADDPKLPDVKSFDKVVIETLRDVHDKGADVYNTSKDFAGAYRMYQGALLTVRPLLAHRPEAQKLIDAGFAAADKETDPARKAVKLHEAIEATRKNLRIANGLVKPPEKKPEEKKPEEKKPMEKKPEEKKPELPVAPLPKEVKPK